jgi:hypothetical protein
MAALAAVIRYAWGFELKGYFNAQKYRFAFGSGGTSYHRGLA